MINIDRIKTVLINGYDAITIKVIKEECSKITEEHDGILISRVRTCDGTNEFESLLGRTVQYGTIIGDKKGRFEDGTSIHTSRVIEIKQIQPNVHLLITRNSKYLEVFLG